MDYGDGTGALAGAVSGGNTCTGPDHSYTDPGVYQVTMAVTDKDLDAGSADAETFIVIYDPADGFVTGGGWIDSPSAWGRRTKDIAPRVCHLLAGGWGSLATKRGRTGGQAASGTRGILPCRWRGSGCTTRSRCSITWKVCGGWSRSTCRGDVSAGVGKDSEETDSGTREIVGID